MISRKSNKMAKTAVGKLGSRNPPRKRPCYSRNKVNAPRHKISFQNHDIDRRPKISQNKYVVQSAELTFMITDNRLF